MFVCVFLSACCPFSTCFTVSYESRLAFTIKAHPDALKARTPLNAARSFNLLLLLLLFCPKTECAAQTVRARELKPGHIVVVVAGTRNPKARPNRPIGGATAQKTKILDVFGRSSLKIDRRFKKMTSLRSLGQPAKKCITTDFLSDARFFPQN